MILSVVIINFTHLELRCPHKAGLIQSSNQEIRKNCIHFMFSHKTHYWIFFLFAKKILFFFVKYHHHHPRSKSSKTNPVCVSTTTTAFSQLSEQNNMVGADARSRWTPTESPRIFETIFIGRCEELLEST
jgi:hypothetical protein